MLAKFYVFRPSALALFLALAGLVALVSVRLPDGLAGVKALLVFGLVATFAWCTFKTQVDRFRDAGAAKLEHSGLVAAVAAHTRPGDVVLIEPFEEFEPRQLRLHPPPHAGQPQVPADQPGRRAALERVSQDAEATVFRGLLGAESAGPVAGDAPAGDGRAARRLRTAGLAGRHAALIPVPGP